MKFKYIFNVQFNKLRRQNQRKTRVMWKIFYIHFISIVKWRVSDRSVTFKFSRFCHFKSFFWVISTSTWQKIKSKLSWEHADFEVMAKIKLATFFVDTVYIHTYLFCCKVELHIFVTSPLWGWQCNDLPALPATIYLQFTFLLSKQIKVQPMSQISGWCLHDKIVNHSVSSDRK